MKLLNIYEAVEYNHKEYLKWKRKNVTIRGAQNVGQANGGGGMLGLGLYVAPLGNRALAKEYGTVYFLIGAIPKTPLVVNSLNEWEIWCQRNLFMKYATGKFPDQRTFFKNSTIEGEMQKMGYDGVIIKGREMVNYNPSDDVKYFQNERQLQMYYEDFIMGKGDNVDEELTYRHADTNGVEDDEYEIGMVKEDYDLSNLHFNDGRFNKIGPNTIYMGDNPIVDFGVGQLGQVNVGGKTFENAMYLQGGFNASVQRKGYGTLGLKFIFTKLPKIQFIILQCLDSAKPFWDKMGGKVIAEKPYGRSTNTLYTMVISRDDFL